MLISVTRQIYGKAFSFDPHPFISDGFIELNKNKVDQVVRLVEENGAGKIGLVGGIAGNTFKSPFSAPFGGFHFQNNDIDVEELEIFIDHFKSYVVERGLSKVEITLPPDIYHQSLNAKTVNALFRAGFAISVPEITHWVDLEKFKSHYSFGSARTKYNQAVKNGLSFNPITELDLQLSAYEIIRENRDRFERPIYMTFDDLKDITKLWPVDFFGITDNTDNMVAAAILYRGHPKIVQAIFWGDSETGRSLRAMDFCLFNLWMHYKDLDYSYVDISTSTKSGIPNKGLLKFKETHDAPSSLRFSFSWSKE